MGLQRGSKPIVGSIPSETVETYGLCSIDLSRLFENLIFVFQSEQKDQRSTGEAGVLSLFLSSNIEYTRTA